MSFSKALTICTALAGFASLALAEAPAKPTPGPEHKKLAFLVGKWTGESSLKENPFMPAGKYASKDNCTWFEGGFAVICESVGSGPMGPMKSLGILGYSTEEKVYTYYGVDNSGMIGTTVAKGVLTGDTWVYTDESMMGGKMVKSRYTIHQLSPTSYTFKWEMMGAEGTWMVLMEGKQTKSH
jgi:hypothetical protein